MIRFTKGHGTENDFLIVADPDGTFRPDAAWVAAACDRRAGVGADGLLRVVRTVHAEGFEDQASGAEWFMDYRNSDGSLAEMCGNGVRVFARYLVDQGLMPAGEFGVGTRDGVKHVVVPEQGDITVTMRVPRVLDEQAQVWVGGEWQQAVNVDMGNPHAVVFVGDVAEAGRLLEAPEFKPASVYPHGVNIEFVAPVAEHHVRMRVFERGSGETRSCGTGACAVMIAAARREGAPRETPYVVDVPGGRLVIVERADGRVEMTGPAVLVADGELR
ncbi:MAG TPA: diaminopimelate epimerase [Actinocrinis sp.]|nr:diaminopimelate epimerase [Actinocrinis sp.]